MPAAVVDACCLIDLLASGHAEAILLAAGLDWHVPEAVQREVRFVRQHDPENPGQVIFVPADLSPLITAGVLRVCQPENAQESERFTQYAAIFRSDGEAMCLAIAESRGWSVATDDRKAIRVAQAGGLSVISCPQLVRTWAETCGPTDVTLNEVLMDIQALAQFIPNSSMPHYQWWMDRLNKAEG